MKEFDIFLNKRLTECDIIVYSLLYYDELTIADRLILESCLESYTLQKFIALQVGSKLVSHIDEMIKICRERLSLVIEIGASTAFQKHCITYPKGVGIEINQENVKMLSVLLTDAENALQITAEPVSVQICKSPGYGSSELILEQSVQDTLKTDVEQFAPSVQISSDVYLVKHMCDGFDTEMQVCTELPNIFYRIYAEPNGRMFVISAETLATILHLFLGYVEPNIVVGADVLDGGIAIKYEAVLAMIPILAELVESVIQVMSPTDNKMQILSEVTAIKRRYRLLYELDPNELLIYDDMSLEDVDYVII